MAKVQEEQLSPESKRNVFGVDKLNTAYQVKIQSQVKVKGKKGYISSK